MADSVPAIGRYGDKKCVTARIDITKASEADHLELGDVVTIKITGKVTLLRGPEEGTREDYVYTKGSPEKKVKKKYIEPGVIELELESFKVKGSTDWSKMDEDED